MNANLEQPQPGNKSNGSRFVLGIDIGTSGVRGVIVEVLDNSENTNGETNITETVRAAHSVSMPLPSRNPSSKASTQNPDEWLRAFNALFEALSDSPYFSKIQHIVADATSSTVLLVSSEHRPLTDALMYDDQQATQQAQTIAQVIEENGYQTAATGPSSTLAKVLFLLDDLKQNAVNLPNGTLHICHQLDWFNFWLTNQIGYTDENNALKLGFDSVNDAWPSWVKACIDNKAKSTGLPIALPKVLKPGQPLATLSSDFAQTWQLSPNVTVHAGTTDSIAGFLASGAKKMGDAVSSLGSTLALKLISNKPIFNSEYGVYSHRLGHHWLVGGASNSGGAVLLHQFTLDELKQAIHLLNQPEYSHLWQDGSNPNYYPLVKAGERFPIADSHLKSRLPARPKADNQTQKLEFLVAILQGLANIEQLGYQRLQALGSSSVLQVFSVGGGTQNPIWQQLRQDYLGVPFCQPDSLDAAFGVTRLVSHFYFNYPFNNSLIANNK